MSICHAFGKYLGFPITNSKPRAYDFQFVIDNMLTRLATWKSKCLIMAGRCTLASASLNALPHHTMQFSLLPSKSLKIVDKF